MNEVTPPLIEQFLEELGRRFERPASIYVFGGSAILLLGGPRSTFDVDFTFTIEAERADQLRQTIQTLAAEMDLDLEESEPAEFMPLPAGVEARRQPIGRYGEIEAYIFDLYSVALMKIDRAFPSDIEDVHFLIQNGHVDLAALEQRMSEILDLHEDKRQFQQNFTEMVRGLKQ